MANASSEPEFLAGTLVLVVGPSGAGKDTLIREAAAALDGDDRFHFPVRSITRAAGGPEMHDPVPAEAFSRAVEQGRFLLHWEAHGVSYGVPAEARDHLARGQVVVVNVSRTVLEEACARFPNSLVAYVTAPPEELARRLAARGRETAPDIASRLARRGMARPAGLRLVTIDNGGAVGVAAGAFLACLAALKGGLAPLPAHRCER